jgi:hypothetical protein
MGMFANRLLRKIFGHNLEQKAKEMYTKGNFIIFLIKGYYNPIIEKVIDDTYSIHGRDKKRIKFSSETLKESDNLRYLGLRGM